MKRVKKNLEYENNLTGEDVPLLFLCYSEKNKFSNGDCIYYLYVNDDIYFLSQNSFNDNPAIYYVVPQKNEDESYTIIYSDLGLCLRNGVPSGSVRAINCDSEKSKLIFQRNEDSSLTIINNGSEDGKKYLVLGGGNMSFANEIKSTFVFKSFNKDGSVTTLSNDELDEYLTNVGN